MDDFIIVCSDGRALAQGRQYRRDGDAFVARSMVVVPQAIHWCCWEPAIILTAIGCATEARRAREFIDLLDGDIQGFSYLSEASAYGHGEQALKWIMGSMAAVLNERGLPFSRVSEVLPPDYLNAFVHSLSGGKFERSFAKDVFTALVAAPRYRDVFGTDVVEEHPEILGGDAVYRGTRLSVAHVSGMIAKGESLDAIFEDYHGLTIEDLIHGEAYRIAREEMGWWETRRIPGWEAVDKLVADPRFQAAKDDAIDALIAEVVAANPDNAAKVTDQPKLVQWFVGQTMKAAKAKGLPPVPAPTVLDKLTRHFLTVPQ